MPLPNYEDFNKAKSNMLKAKALRENDEHQAFADEFYKLIEKDLARGYDYFNTGEVTLTTPSGGLWRMRLASRCEKEGWILVPNNDYSYYSFKMKHKKDHNWLTRKLKGWN